jgi:hypothetical protein
MKSNRIPSKERSPKGCGFPKLTPIGKVRKLLLAISSILILAGGGALAQVEVPFFLEDFEDGDATDGNPVTWITPLAPPSTRGSTATVSDGSYVLTTQGASSRVAQEFTSIGDVSIRVLARGLQVGSGTYIALSANLQPDGRSHWALVTQFGLHTGSGLPGSSGIIGTVFAPGSFDPFVGDVNIQLDVVGTKMSLTVWRVGSPKPSRPQLISSAPSLPPGSVGFGTDYSQIALRSFDAIQIPPPRPTLTWQRVDGNVLQFTVPAGFELRSSLSMDSLQWPVAGEPNSLGQLEVTVSNPARFFQLRSK